MSGVETKAGIKDLVAIATHHGFCEFFKLARTEYNHPGYAPTIKRRFSDGHSIKVTRTRSLSIDFFGVHVRSSQLDENSENRLLYFSFDKKGLGRIDIGGGEVVVERRDLPDNRDFARLSSPLTQWVMKCFQDGEYRPLPKEIRERIVEFAQISQIESQKQHSGLSP